MVSTNLRIQAQKTLDGLFKEVKGIQAQKTLDGLFKEVKGASTRLNLLVEGGTIIQLLENGLRPQYLFKQCSAGG